jgi:hypothetical protein
MSANNWAMVVYGCYPSYMGGHRRKEDDGLRLAPGKNTKPYLKNN